MNRNFQRSLSFVLEHEGGFVNHPRDPGGATNKGITIGTYRRYVNRKGTVNDLKNITDEQVAKVYRKQYWDAVKGDDLPSGIDYAVFDFAVNSGPSRAAKFLQRALGVTQDGKIGPVTIAAAQKADGKQLIDRLCADRLAWLKRLPHWGTFKRGWTARVSAVETRAREMVVPRGDVRETWAEQVRTEVAPPPEPPKPGLWATIIAAILAFLKKGI